MPEHSVGIDLGTTNALIACIEGDSPVVIPGEDGEKLVPCIVAVDDYGKVVVGNSARKWLIEAPERAVSSIRPLMGRGRADVASEIERFRFRVPEQEDDQRTLRVQVADRVYSAPEISAFILRQLLRNAERHLGEQVAQAVVAVPAYFNEAQRQATIDAGRIAGFKAVRLLDEPSAAAFAYELQKRGRGTFAVYDLGGATFDVAILRLENEGAEQRLEVIATNGDSHLGGDEIDRLLLAIALDDIKGEFNLDYSRNAVVVQALRKQMIDLKVLLSSQKMVRIEYRLPDGRVYGRELVQQVFRDLIDPILQRTVEPCRAALADAKVTGTVDEVVLVGGSTRIPRVREIVQHVFQRTPRGELNPDEVIALGAALRADMYRREQSTAHAPSP